MTFFTKPPAAAEETWRVATSVLVIWSSRSRRRSLVRCLDTQRVWESNGEDLVRQHTNVVATVCKVQTRPMLYMCNQ
jgi:hypothetical protein